MKHRQQNLQVTFPSRIPQTNSLHALTKHLTPTGPFKKHSEVWVWVGAAEGSSPVAKEAPHCQLGKKRKGVFRSSPLSFNGGTASTR